LQELGSAAGVEWGGVGWGSSTPRRLGAGRLGIAAQRKLDGAWCVSTGTVPGSGRDCWNKGVKLEKGLISEAWQGGCRRLGQQLWVARNQGMFPPWGGARAETLGLTKRGAVASMQGWGRQDWRWGKSDRKRSVWWSQWQIFSCVGRKSKRGEQGGDVDVTGPLVPSFLSAGPAGDRGPQTPSPCPESRPPGSVTLPVGHLGCISLLS
jgi:hypothetical protein